MLAIHPGILPFDRKRSVVANLVQCPQDSLKVNRASANRPEVPKAARIAEIKMPAEYARFLRLGSPGDIFHMDMEDARGELADKCNIVNTLVTKVAGIVVETKSWMAIDCIQCIFCAGDVKSDLRRVNF